MASKAFVTSTVQFVSGTVRFVGRSDCSHAYAWLNLVERFFRDLSQQAILSGSCGSVPELVDALMQYLTRHSLQPKRYVWRADGAAVLAKTQRAWEAAFRTPEDVTVN